MKRLLALSLVFSSASNASDWIQYNSGDWNDYKDESFAVLAKPENINSNTELDRVLVVHISHSVSGKQKIYIKDQYVGKHDSCDTSENGTFVVAKFDNQPVKMILYCETFTNVNIKYAYATPETNKGLQYVVNLFKKKSGSVNVEFHGLNGQISAKGFTKAWNSAGGNAI